MSGGGRREQHSRTAPVALGVLGVLAVLLVPAGAAGAETAIDITAGVNSYTDEGDDVVVRVSVTADELVDGSIVVAAPDSGRTVRQDIQVPAGTTKEALLVVPTSRAGRLTVEVRHGGDVVAQGATVLRADGATELVGVLPRLLARTDELAEQATLDSGTGRAELAALGTDVLDLGTPALDVYDTVVGDGDELAALTDAQRRSLLLWVHAGGRLLLEGSTDVTSSIAALPDEWRPADDATYALVGLGEIRIVEGTAAGEWARLIEPSGAADETLSFGEDVMFDGQLELAERAGVRLPSLAPLIIAVAVYGFVIGPILYLALRRARRLTLGWVAIPVLALLTTGAIVVAGNRYRAAGNPATATFVEDTPVGALTLTNVLTFSRNGGERDVDLPARWHLDASGDFYTGQFGTGGELVGAADGTRRFELRLDAGQVTTTTFAGETDPVGLVLTAALADGEVAGTVTNATSLRLRDVVVFAGNDSATVRELEAGATADWSVSAPRDVGLFLNRAQRAWLGQFGGPPGPPQDDQLVEFGIYGAASLKWELYPTGMARAVGWTEDLPTVLDAGDDPSDRAAVSVLAPIEANGTPPGVTTTRVAIVRSPNAPGNNGVGTDQVYRYVLAPDAELDGPGTLTLTAPDDTVVSELAFWDGTEWIESTLGEDVAVPAAAVREGVVLVRTELSGMGDPFFVPTVQTVEAGP